MGVEVDTSPRKAPRQARSRATVDAILTATAQILVEEGYDKATTNTIARRAGVSIGSLYQYFPNKEALVTALCERHLHDTTRVLMGAIETLKDAPLPEAIRRLIDVLLRIHAVEPELHRVLIEQVPRLSGFEAITQIDRVLIDMIRTNLSKRVEALRPRDLELAAFILVHGVQGVTHAAVLDRPDALHDDVLATEITDLVLRYLMR
jgi:AcrR family transcriptional regulator